jgi:uncharacterized protein (DUF2252 family)
MIHTNGQKTAKAAQKISKSKREVVSTDRALIDHSYTLIEAAAHGKALREVATRASHGGWRPTAKRRDPMEVLIESGAGRLPELIPIRYGRMLQSSFTFYRGAAAIMAADLATTPSTGLYVQACGDCHLLNFGVFATPERKLIFDVNDFDETLAAPWEWDVKRLATSFVIASHNNNFSKSVAKEIARACVQSYRARTEAYGKMKPLDVWYATITVEDGMQFTQDEKWNKRIKERIKKEEAKVAEGRGFPEVTEMKYGSARIKDNPPLIYHMNGMKRKELLEWVDAIFSGYFASLGEEKKVLVNQYKYQDVAVKVVGVGSVGTLCGVMLRMSVNSEPLYLQIKEALPSVLEPYAGKSAYENNGERVVVGQRLMQAASDMFLGWTKGLKGRHFYVRQLHDMKIKPMVEVYDERVMKEYAQICGWSLARSHARSGKAAIISGYMGNSTKFEDAIAQFAVEYAAQNESDYQALKEAVRDGRIEVFPER